MAKLKAMTLYVFDLHILRTRTVAAAFGEFRRQKRIDGLGGFHVLGR